MEADSSCIQDYFNRQPAWRLDTFIETALWHPEWGYYRHQLPIGRTGDFVTAPEVTSLFGEMLGLWVVDLWERSGMPTPVHLIELGPGNGTLMADILATCRIRPTLQKHIHGHCIEINPYLIQKQKQHLATYSCFWHQDLETIPPGFTLIIANEFFDVFPIRQLHYTTHQSWREAYIKTQPAPYQMSMHPIEKSDPILAHWRCQQTEKQADSTFDVIELSELDAVWSNAIAHRLKMNIGAALIIDYGDEIMARYGDTLQVLYQHRYSELLKHVGQSDITHHVDFLNLKYIFQEAELPVYGSVTQGRFLTQLGILHRVKRFLESYTGTQRSQITQAVERLISRQGMGNLFKVLAVTSKDLQAPSGFPSLS